MAASKRIPEMMKKSATWLLGASLGVVLVNAAPAQTAKDVQGLTKEIEALKAGQTAIQKDLQDIKAMLQGVQAQAQQAAQPAAQAARPAIEPVDLMLSVVGSPAKGEANAKVTLVEFTDYQCPFCSRHYRQTWPKLEQEYVKTGKAKLVLRDLPLEQIHPLAFKAAEASHCAGDQGKYWEMHDRLFANQNTLARGDLTAHAQALALDVDAFDKCVDSGKGAARIRKDVADSEKIGARSTPVFFLGLTDPNSAQLKAIRVIRGAHPYSVFKEAIDGLLASAN
jgi:protein-disulfide isomerase